MQSLDKSSTRERALLSSYDPSTGELLGAVEGDGRAQVDRTVQAARAAGRTWRMLTVRERADRLRAAIGDIASAKEELSRLVAREVGKTLREARHEVDKLDQMATTLTELELALADELLVAGTIESRIVRRGFGVAAVVAPWNYPVLMPHRLVVPALVAGNAVLFKPSEHAPLSGQRYAELLGAHLPEGVLQVVHGGPEQGAALVEQAELVAFVGSRATGKRILAAGAPSLTRVILELGGSDPLLVFADADLDAAVAFAVRNAFRNAGQACTCTRRALVARELYAQFQAAVVSRAQALRVGNGLGPEIDLGPLIGPTHKSRFMSGVGEAVRAGAQLLCGGDAGGNFVRPLVLQAPPEVNLGAEELFGPCLFLSAFDSEREAIASANATPYGLGATLFTRDPARAARVAAQLEAGMVGINGACLGAQGSPWVGSKESGYGFHGSSSGHRQFAQTHVVSIHAA